MTSTCPSTVTAPSQRIVVFCSDVAAAVGCNTYTTRKEVAQKVLGMRYGERVDVVETAVQAAGAAASKRPRAVEESARRAGLHAQADALRDVLAQPDACPASRERLAHDIACATVRAVAGTVAATHTVTELNTREGAAAALLRSCDMPSAALAAVKRVAYTARGTRDEAPALALYGEKAGVAVIAGNGRFRCKSIAANLAVGGKEDGMTADGTTVIEVKRRQRGFFSVIPLRELIQLFTYMFVTNTRRGVWCQYYDGAVQTQTVEWDDVTWSQIVAGLTQFRAVLQPVLAAPDEVTAKSLLAALPDDLRCGRGVVTVCASPTV